MKELLDAGVQAVAVGTLLMRTDEAGTSDIHRRALTDPAFTETTLTRAFTGRLARALRNHFIDSHDAYAVDAIPGGASSHEGSKAGRRKGRGRSRAPPVGRHWPPKRA